MGQKTYDFVVIGGGVCGVTMALELRRRQADASVAILEKEPHCGEHASGRNSGVLHAGFYYTADSLKARFTRDGCQAMKDYCASRDLPVRRCGKLVVARTEEEERTLEVLLERGAANGVELQQVDLQQAREIEPRVLSTGRCIFSPNTASVDPVQVMASLTADARAAGIDVLTSCRVTGRDGDKLRTSAGDIHAGYVVNAAGLYADRIARLYGFGDGYTIMPFKGLYLEVEEPQPVRVHIYPVPNIRNPFLGVHYTLGVDGAVTLGPTAIPAFWREHYTGMHNFDLREMLSITTRQLGLAIRNDFGFRQLALDELPKYLKRNMVRMAQELAMPSAGTPRYRWRRPGIRAQLIDTRSNRLEMDFLYQGDNRSFHVLNAVSPAFTCSLPFSRYLVDRIEALCG